MTHLKKNFLDILIYLLSYRGLTSGAIHTKQNFLKEIESVAKCILTAADDDTYRRSTVIINSCEYIDDSSFVNDDYVRTLTQSLARAYIPQIVIKNCRHLSKTVENYEEHLLIVHIINGCNSLKDLNKTIKENYRHLIIINDKIKRMCHLELNKIGSSLQHQDATFILRDSFSSGHRFLTTLPEINEDTCQYDDNVSLTHINTCTNGKLKDVLIFRNKKPRNFKKCEFKVGMATMYPYAVAKNRDSLRNLQQLSECEVRGSDVEIIKIISNWYNASLKLYYIYREEENPYIHQDFVSFVINGSLEVCAGGLYRVYGDFVYYSGIYSSQTVTWVYAVEREPKSLQTTMRKSNGLYVFISFYFAYSILWILFCNFDNIPVSVKNTFLYSWGALIGTSCLQDSKTWKQKLLNISYLLLCLHLSAFISALLYSSFTIQGPPVTLKANDDVMESGRTPYLVKNSKYVIKDSKYTAFVNTSNDCVNFKDCERKMLLNKGLTILIEAYFHRFQAFTAIDNEARVLRPKENIYVVYHEMIIRKDSPFVGKFETIIKRLFEAGICDHLYLKAIGLYAGKARNANDNIMANSYRCISGCSINISQIAGAFFVWLIGCILSFIIFLIEVYINK